MATSLDFARELIASADRDLVILEKCVPDPEIATEVRGFHCQQAVEKYIKAVLAVRQIEFRKIHDIKTLTDLAKDAGLDVPLAEQLEALTPFAVAFRYQALGSDQRPRKHSPGSPHAFAELDNARGAEHSAPPAQESPQVPVISTRARNPS